MRYLAKVFLGTTVFLAGAAQAAQTDLISRGLSNTLADNASNSPAINNDGTKVVFESTASNLATGSNGKQHVYLYNRSTNATLRISAASDGTAGNNLSRQPDISADGNHVVFTSFATNLSGDAAGSQANIYWHNLPTRTTRLISKPYNDTSANAASETPTVSQDGRFIAFASSATNLVAGDSNGLRDIFLYDTSTNLLERINIGASGQQANGDSFASIVSANGEWVLFASVSNNLVTTPLTSANYNVYLYNRLTRTLSLVTYNSSGATINARSSPTSISDDGRFVTYYSLATNMSPLATDGLNHVYLYDRVSNTTTVVDIATNGAAGNSQSLSAFISGNGRFISFYSRASNLVANDTNNNFDVFVYDRILKTTEIATLTSGGQQLNPSLSNVNGINYDGQYVVFATSANNLDTNGFTDIYMRVRDPIANIKPVAVAGNNIAAQCTASNTSVTLDGSSSYDNDGTIIDYTWTGSFGSVKGSRPTVSLAPGITSITLTVTDDKQETNSASILVTITDSTAPVVTGQTDVTLEATRVDGAAYNVQYSVSDNCSGTFVTINPTPAFYPLGVTPVTITATDTSGNSGNDVVNVTVRDTTPPLLQLPNDVRAEATGITTPVAIGMASATDIFTVTIQNNDKLKYPLGTSDVTWIATDANGNNSQGIQKVTVVDTTPPVVTVGENVTLEATRREGAPFTPNYNVNDSCGCGVIQISIDPNWEYFPLGETPFSILAQDISGNTGSATGMVKVVDTTPPLLQIPADVTVEANAVESHVDIGQAQASDIFDVVISNNAPLSYPLGTTDVIWTATDVNGNRNNATQHISVRDTTAPVFASVTAITQEASARLTPIVLTQPVAQDIFTVQISHNGPATYPLGITQVIWTAKDASGNQSTLTQDVKVVDTTPPVLTVPQNIKTEATNTLTTVAIGQATATDIFDVTISNDAPASFRLGTTPIHWQAKDSNGNQASGVQSIEIVDTTPPKVNLGADVTMEATSANGANFSLKLDVTDSCNCGPIDVTVTPQLTTYPLGDTVVTVTAKDISGNTGSDTLNVRVIDTTPPVLTVSGAITVEATGELTTLALAGASATDLFGVTISHNAPAAYPVGTTLVTWTAVDNNGNRSSAQQAITVVDTTAPQFTLDVLKDRLWSPRHKLVLAAVVRDVKDLVDGKPAVNIVVTDNSQDARRHQHDKDEIDWNVVQNGNRWEIYLRAEKENHGRADRIYHIDVTASDRFGNTANQSADVTVPHDRRYQASNHDDHQHKNNNKHNKKHNDKRGK